MRYTIVHPIFGFSFREPDFFFFLFFLFPFSFPPFFWFFVVERDVEDIDGRLYRRPRQHARQVGLMILFFSERGSGAAS